MYEYVIYIILLHDMYIYICLRRNPVLAKVLLDEVVSQLLTSIQICKS